MIWCQKFPDMWNKVLKHKLPLAIFTVWLFHVSAIIGITLGNREWFISKTPLNLVICLLLFLWAYPLRSRKEFLAFAFFAAGGMFAEWLGVNYGLLFGTYQYGTNFGPKLDGVPILIGLYWALLTFITASICDYVGLNRWLKAILAAVLMVLLDFFMEHSAPLFDFWTFAGNDAPLENYITWFALGLIFQIVLRFMGIHGNKTYSLHLYIAQLLFFCYFYIVL